MVESIKNGQEEENKTIEDERNGFTAKQIHKREHCIKYAKIRVFTDPFSPAEGQNLRFCPYRGEYGSAKTRILSYFMQWNVKWVDNAK